MSLITCPDCGKPVSSHAAACPACGQPLAPKSHVGLWVGLGCLATAMITFCLAIIIGLLVWIGITLQPSAEDGMETDELAPQEATTCHCDPAHTSDDSPPMEENSQPN
ncbi:MAG: zinc-ribbon domain-containing protein [Verrucomicrobia bacterium]|nr:MAG: zinc-ribbon domain-containing protein [Verrucomicrobiota bacterium]